MFSMALVGLGCVFITIGTIGLVRFPDLYSKLHALAKVDNVGLGCIALGLMLDAPSLSLALKIGAIWLLTLVSSASLAYIIASAKRKEEVFGAD
ncbi:MAG: monovalent cation/H(+) antiporter subunit G [Campylobacterales bacterium]|nr:monovalent cation/H(+) antiporter subunit G [Campylobacterales bacterium]